MIPQHLIENALALTGKQDFEFCVSSWEAEFSYPKFFYYLLSPEFIEKILPIWKGDEYKYLAYVAYCIKEYQSGNEAPIISLLEKIGTNQTS